MAQHHCVRRPVGGRAVNEAPLYEEGAKHTIVMVGVNGKGLVESNWVERVSGRRTGFEEGKGLGKVM